jgi:hypothetical protein
MAQGLLLHILKYWNALYRQAFRQSNNWRLTMPRYIIQFDNHRRYGVRVCTMSGIALAYFRHFDDAVKYCEAEGKAKTLLASEG